MHSGPLASASSVVDPLHRSEITYGAPSEPSVRVGTWTRLMLSWVAPGFRFFEKTVSVTWIPLLKVVPFATSRRAHSPKRVEHCGTDEQLKALSARPSSSVTRRWAPGAVTLP